MLPAVIFVAVLLTVLLVVDALVSQRVRRDPLSGEPMYEWTIDLADVLAVAAAWAVAAWLARGGA